jgi:energy-coupling factor transport system permease protein
VSPGPAAALLAALGAAALLAHHIWTPAAICVVLLSVCLQAPWRRLRLYLLAVAIPALTVFVATPFVESIGFHIWWSGPVVPVLGRLDVTSEEVLNGGTQALRLAAVMLAFLPYALLMDHDRLVSGASLFRRSALAVALATRLVPTLERDASGLVEALRGRGLEPKGTRAWARLVSPLVAGSLERGLNLAESMEARGFGRPGRTRTPKPPWRAREYASLAAASLLVIGGVLWL